MTKKKFRYERTVIELPRAENHIAQHCLIDCLMCDVSQFAIDKINERYRIRSFVRNSDKA